MDTSEFAVKANDVQAKLDECGRVRAMAGSSGTTGYEETLAACDALEAEVASFLDRVAVLGGEGRP